MYMNDSAAAYVRPLRGAFELFEEEHGVPVRVLHGGWMGGFAPPPWRGREVADSDDMSVEVATARGLTVVISGLRSLQSEIGMHRLEPRNYPEHWGAITPTLDNISTSTDVTASDVVQMEPFPNGGCYVEIGERVVYIGATITEEMCRSEHFDFDRVFGEPMRMAIDFNFHERLAELRSEQDRAAFATLAMRGPDQLLHDVRYRISVEEDRLHQATRDLTAAQRALNLLRQEADALLASNDLSRDELLARYDRLRNHPRITDTRVEGDVLVFVTDELTLSHPEDPERSAPLGRIEVKIHMTAAGAVEMRNLDRPRGGRAHPHCAQAGTPCFGTISQSVSQFIATHEYEGLVELLLQFLQTYNPADDYGRYAGYWFEVPRDREEIAA